MLQPGASLLTANQAGAARQNAGWQSAEQQLDGALWGLRSESQAATRQAAEQQLDGVEARQQPLVPTARCSLSSSRAEQLKHQWTGAHAASMLPYCSLRR